MHNDIFYGINEPTKEVVASRKRVNNSSSLQNSTSISDYQSWYVQCALIITTVDDLKYTFRFTFENGENPAQFLVNEEHYFNMRVKLIEVLKIVINQMIID